MIAKVEIGSALSERVIRVLPCGDAVQPQRRRWGKHRQDDRDARRRVRLHHPGLEGEVGQHDEALVRRKRQTNLTRRDAARVADDDPCGERHANLVERQRPVVKLKAEPRRRAEHLHALCA